MQLTLRRSTIWPMSREIPRTLSQLEHFPLTEALEHVRIEGRSRVTGLAYDFWFIFNHPHGPYIKIDSPQRHVFLSRFTERDVQDDIEQLAQETRKRSGGVFNIHPFYGAVWGTKLTPVAPNFLTDLPQPDENLMMLIYLSETAKVFSRALTRQAEKIGTVVVIPSQKASNMLEYMQAAQLYPNQTGRDQAIVNRLGDRWDAEYQRFNTDSVPYAMTLNLRSIVGVMRSLERGSVIFDTFIKGLLTVNDLKKYL